MKVKVRNLADQITEIVKNQDGVQAVILQHFAEKNVFDPNFSVSIDVFRNAEIPAAEERRKMFPGARFFETSPAKDKDRFLVNDLPVRISYKDTSRVDAVLACTDGDCWLHMERGTYLFYRIVTGTALWSRGEWLGNVLKHLDSLPDSFWQVWFDSTLQRIDHLLGDLTAADMNADRLYFQMSLAGFLKTSAEALFAANRTFEPGPRDFSATLELMENIPEGFQANWDSLLREDSELPSERKREIAELLVRGITELSP